MARSFRYILPPHLVIEEVVAGEFELCDNTEITKLKHGDRWYNAQASDWCMTCPEGWVCLQNESGEFEYDGEAGCQLNVEFEAHTDYSCSAALFTRNTGAWALIPESEIETTEPEGGGAPTGSISFVYTFQPGDKLRIRLKNGDAGDIVLCNASIKIRGS